jgi:SAM-dependent methyltransferase
MQRETSGTQPIQLTRLGHGLDYVEEGRNDYAWLAESFAPYLRRKVVEHGAGNGMLSTALLARGVTPMVLTEPDPNLASMLRTRFQMRNDVEVFEGPLESYWASTGPGHIDGIVSSNVLEHVVDDVACLRVMWSLLRPGGILAVYVPARPELYGEFDREVGHHRRYRLEELRNKLQSANFNVEHISYRNLVGAFAWWLSGRVLKKRSIGQSSVRIYDKVVFPVSRFLEDRFPPPYGLNLLVIAQKI